MAIPPVQNTIETTANNILTSFQGEDAPKISIELFRKKLGKTPLDSIPRIDLSKKEEIFDRTRYSICETTQNEIVLYSHFELAEDSRNMIPGFDQAVVIHVISDKRWSLYCDQSGFNLFSRYLREGECNDAGFEKDYDAKTFTSDLNSQAAATHKHKEVITALFTKQFAKDLIKYFFKSEITRALRGEIVIQAQTDIDAVKADAETFRTKKTKKCIVA